MYIARVMAITTYPKSTIRFQPEQNKKLRELAKRSGMSVSAIVKHCVAAELPKLRRKYEG